MRVEVAARELEPPTERRACTGAEARLHRKLEDLRRGASDGVEAEAWKIPLGRAIWRTRRRIRDCTTARRGAAQRGTTGAKVACELGGGVVLSWCVKFVCLEPAP